MQKTRVSGQNKIRIWCFLAFLLLPMVVFAKQKPDAGQPGYFLKLATDARILGMGGAGVAYPDSGIFINPAGIAVDKKKRLQLTSIALLFPDTSYNFLSYTQPVGKKWGIGLGVPILRVTGAEKKRGEYESSGRFDDQQIALGLGLAQSFSPEFSAGLTLKAIQQQFYEETTSTSDIDIGLIYQHLLSRDSGGSSISMGICFQNILGSTIKGDKMPQTIKAGISYRPIDGVLLAMDMKKSSGQAIRLHLGGECSLDFLSLRAGYDDQGYLTAGVGIRTRGFIIDYGLQDHDYTLSHRVSVGVRFGK